MSYPLLLSTAALAAALAALVISWLAVTEFRALIPSVGEEGWQRSSFLAKGGIGFGALATALLLTSSIVQGCQ